MDESLAVAYVAVWAVIALMASGIAWIDGECDRRIRVLGARVAIFSWAWPVMALGAAFAGMRALWIAAEFGRSTDTEGSK